MKNFQIGIAEKTNSKVEIIYIKNLFEFLTVLATQHGGIYIKEKEEEEEEEAARKPGQQERADPRSQLLYFKLVHCG